MRRRYIFTVKGRGSFPFEMLARDQAFPADETQADVIRYACPTQAPAHEITFITYQHAGPSHAGWADCEWPIIKVSSE